MLREQESPDENVESEAIKFPRESCHSSEIS